LNANIPLPPDSQNKDLREGSSDTRFKDAEDQLNSYAAIIKTLTKQVCRAFAPLCSCGI
jgi:hypothetical protein